MLFDDGTDGLPVRGVYIGRIDWMVEGDHCQIEKQIAQGGKMFQDEREIKGHKDTLRVVGHPECTSGINDHDPRLGFFRERGVDADFRVLHRMQIKKNINT